MTFEKLICCVNAVVLLGAGGSSAWAASDANCSGGPIASGVYSDLNITGAFAVDKGPVTVLGNLTVLPGDVGRSAGRKS